MFLDEETDEAVNDSDTESEFSGGFQEEMQARTKQKMRGNKIGQEKEDIVKSVEMEATDSEESESDDEDESDIEDESSQEGM